MDKGTRFLVSASVSTGFSLVAEITLFGCERTFGDDMNIVVKRSKGIVVPLGRSTKNDSMVSVPF
jgi:hypothetical protein